VKQFKGNQHTAWHKHGKGIPDTICEEEHKAILGRNVRRQAKPDAKGIIVCTMDSVYADEE
jgi:hypothetical protein